MYGLLLFIPTLALMPHSTFIFPFLYFFLKNQNRLDQFSFDVRKINRNLLIISFFILLTFINKLLYYHKMEGIQELIPYTVLMLLSYFYSTQVQRSDLKVLIYLILFESLVVIAEYFMGVNTFIPQLAEFNESLTIDPGSLYYSRPLGLSNNSSVIAYKIFIAYLLLDFLNLKSKIYQFIRLFFLIAIFFTFNRTVFLVLIIYISLQHFKPFFKAVIDFINLRVSEKHKWKILFIGFGIFAAGVFLFMNFSEIYLQLTRNKGFDLSGRDEIWIQFYVFIKDHFWLGNGSFKYLVPYNGDPIHAHNSFLQIIANNGFLISSLLFYMIIINWNRKNRIYLIGIFIYSLFQYGIFWGISLIDILFFVFLFRKDLLEDTKPNNEQISSEDYKTIDLK